ncbi:hypothetical protein NLU13_3004 [Sarocladium strictum]|uniref:A-pheromone processing metallopeptidase Ste23 n=1 Tax=Sarocladium strictum TaxID=5046 RepID=A0AA39GM11_SARSR|nr:hypothetical protein NLU13_3004 [Sarocladium strictum]
MSFAPHQGQVRITSLPLSWSRCTLSGSYGHRLYPQSYPCFRYQKPPTRAPSFTAFRIQARWLSSYQRYPASDTSAIMTATLFPASAPCSASSATLLTDRLEKPSLDDRQYRVIQLPNKLEALLVHDPETDKASAALDVNVGNFSDESDMPGMAHAVEHLLFMGTKKFPVENEYGQYLSSHSGSSNAYTAATSTNYYFEVAAKPANDEEPTLDNPSPLYGALDRFSQFFIEPLFLASTLDRELKAVDSENKKNLQSDTWRLHQLEKSLSNPNHPYCHFSTGNLEVLKIQPEAEGVNVRDKFMEFHSKHYSANRMKLVILGREQLDVLEKWATEFFSDVVNKELPPNRWTDEVPFRDVDLGMQCFAKPVMDSRELNLYFPFIDEEHLFESQPSRYISHLIGHEGPGSIMAYIKNKGWANGLGAGAYPVCPGTPGMFDVTIRLTEEGLAKYQEVVKIFFQYVSMLRELPPQEWIFEEQKGMADVDFKFKQKTPASRFTSKTSSVMQKPLPREWLLSGGSRLRTFNPALISEALDKLQPDNLRLSIISRDFPGDWDQKEKWYGTQYKYEKIPESFMAELRKAAQTSSSERVPELHLPHKNSFIPSKLEVEKKEVAEPALAPRLLRNDCSARTWWKKDDTFWVPQANVIVCLQTPLLDLKAKSTALGRLYTELVRDALEEYSYDAELAGLQYSVGLESRGLWLDISGYNDKLLVLLDKVTTTLKNLEIKSDRFEIVKERLTRGYNNWQLQSSYQQVGDYMSWLISERDNIVEMMAAELPSITAPEVSQFRDEVLKDMHIEVYVHGNMYRNDALKATNLIESTLSASVLPPEKRPNPRSFVLPEGSNFVFNKTLQDPANVNHCVETFFHIGERGDRTIRARTLLIDQMLHEPAFDQLRTKEQLGYVVFSGMRSLFTTCGIRFLIQSERTPQYLDTRIEAFLARYGETLAGMTEKEFEGHKRSVIVKRLEKLKNLNQESSRHWQQISNEFYDFEQAQSDAAHVKRITKDEMVAFYKKYLDPSSKERARLSVHLHAQGASELDKKMIALLQGLDLTKDVGLKRALQESENVDTTLLNADAVQSAVEITDANQFKAGLRAVSGGRPLYPLSDFEDSETKL